MIDINDLINENLICTEINANSKDEVLMTLASLAHKNGNLNCSCASGVIAEECQALKLYVDSLKAREAQYPTSVGYSFAIPHGKCSEVKSAFVLFGKLKNEMQWSEEDTVKNVFMIGVSDSQASNEHLEILIKLSTSILEDDFREKLDSANTKQELADIIKEYASKAR